MHLHAVSLPLLLLLLACAAAVFLSMPLDGRPCILTFSWHLWRHSVLRHLFPSPLPNCCAVLCCAVLCREYYGLHHLEAVLLYQATKPHTAGPKVLCKDVHGPGCKFCKSCHLCRHGCHQTSSYSATLQMHAAPITTTCCCWQWDTAVTLRPLCCRLGQRQWRGGDAYAPAGCYLPASHWLLYCRVVLFGTRRCCLPTPCTAAAETCRQKTVCKKTFCPCSQSGGRGRGYWCGACLQLRIGENIEEVCDAVHGEEGGHMGRGRWGRAPAPASVRFNMRSEYQHACP